MRQRKKCSLLPTHATESLAEMLRIRTAARNTVDTPKRTCKVTANDDAIHETDQELMGKPTGPKTASRLPKLRGRPRGCRTRAAQTAKEQQEAGQKLPLVRTHLPADAPMSRLNKK